jgi:hypothetical protein
MRFVGVVSEDQPDPLWQAREQARQMPVPVVGLVPQPHIEDWGAIGVSSASRNGVLESSLVGISYTLWRNPDEPDDPVNLAELGQDLRRDLEAEPPWPRPAWLLERLRRMRYPTLWDCARTRWSREPGELDTVRHQLVEHVNHILINQFRQTRITAGDGDLPYNLDNPAEERHVESDIPVLVDGTARTGVRIDTDPDMYGVGVDLGPHAVLTAAIPRDALPYLQVAFAVRPH